MRGFPTAVLLAALIAPCLVHAAEPAAQVAPEDYVKAIQAAPAAGAASSAPAATPANPCAAGSEPDEDGLCAPVVQTRGFSLATGAAASSAKPAAQPHHAAVARASAPVPIRVSAPSPASRLSDLLITFRLGSAELTEQGRANAHSFGTALQNPAILGTRFEIAGHTDASGSPERNTALSQARAEAVKTFLVSLGVDAARLEAKGYGSSDLAEPNAPRAAANRRVEARRLN